MNDMGEIINAVRWLSEPGQTVHENKSRREQVERLILALRGEGETNAPAQQTAVLREALRKAQDYFARLSGMDMNDAQRTFDAVNAALSQADAIAREGEA